MTNWKNVVVSHILPLIYGGVSSRLPQHFKTKEPGHIRITASYNDLLLCKTTSKSLWRMRSGQRYYLCNLPTKRWLVLPAYPDEYEDKEVIVGMVHNDVNKEDSLRVMRIPLSQSSTNTFVVEIFSSQTNRWTESHALHPHKVDVFEKVCWFSSCCNATLHWLTTGNDVIAYNPYNPEKCQLLIKPIGFNCHSIISTWLVACQGTSSTLQLAQTDKRYLGSAAIRIWELMSYDTGEWNMKHELFLDRLARTLSSDEPELEPLTVLPNITWFLSKLWECSVIVCPGIAFVVQF